MEKVGCENGPNLGLSQPAIFVIFEQHPAKVVEKQFINENRLTG
jgi:hypothetical protein